MVDARMRRLGDCRLGMKRNAKPGALQHRQIVRAIADGKRLGKINLVFADKPQERVLFRGPPEYGVCNCTCQSVVRCQQFVCLGRVESTRGADALGKERKSAGNERRHRAGRIHGFHQRFSTRRQGDALLERRLQHGNRQAFQHRDAFGQRCLEIQLAAHGAFGNRGDFRALSGKLGELIDAFLFDDR